MNGQPVTGSTATPITLAQWVPTLLRWYPLRHGVVVGASQQAIQLLNAKPEKLTLFKANTGQTKPHPPEANVFDWVIADQNCPTSFYQASLVCESGLLDPQLLKTCWPGIRCVTQQEVEARTLDTALQAINPTVAANWLWVGSLPAASVLLGATQMLQQADVVAVRVATYAGVSVHAGMQSVQTLMAQQGFVLCGIEPERNPKLGTALFMRDHPAAYARAIKQLQEQGRAQAELQARLHAETKAKQAEAAAKSEAEQQRDELAKVKADLQAMLNAETKAKQMETQAKDQMVKERDTFEKENEQLEKEKQAAVNKASALQNQANDSNTRLAAVEAENKNLLLVQEALKNEITNAQEQIELIKVLMHNKVAHQ